ncbi:MAG: 2-oxo-4-hydroxy-4-carboxy-5-ureidoimidazoline decarboxylase [Woeseiaceae bacterium]
MDKHDFIARYGGIYEHSPWVAEQVAAVAAGIEDPGKLAELMADCVDNADTEQQLALIRAHPQLACKVRSADEMTEESSREQASAGLDKCSKVEFEKFEALNDAYKQKFGFPFVMAVRGSTRQEVLDALSRRLQNDANAEFETALAEIHKIARLRLESMEPRA